MATDATEDIRRLQQATINAAAGDRAKLEAERGQVWDTDELQRDFEVLGFLAPYIAVRRKSDGRRGSLLFQHHPRYYFRFQEE